MSSLAIKGVANRLFKVVKLVADDKYGKWFHHEGGKFNMKTLRYVLGSAINPLYHVDCFLHNLHKRQVTKINPLLR